MWKKWFPWRWIVRRVAQKQGFLDPIALMSRLQRFAQPSEVVAPVELIRLATVLQARGLMNVQAIQHNLDWIWPYWVIKQFNPRDPAFIPRAFSLTHINLTHRNWTAVGLPDCAEFPLVDPRGLLTPFYDSWSVDAWIIQELGEDLIPSRSPAVSQHWGPEKYLCLQTQIKDERAKLFSRIAMESSYDKPFCRMEIEASSETPAWLAISLRPYNPEGISEVEDAVWQEDQRAWLVNQKHRLYFSEPPEANYFSEYHEGDVYQKIVRGRTALPPTVSDAKVHCNAGMATAAVLFRIPPGGTRKIDVRIPYDPEPHAPAPRDITQSDRETHQTWEQALEGSCKLQIADSEVAYLYEAAVKTLVLHTPNVEVYPGPYTYKHFWFRDAAFILHALLAAHLPKRVERILDHFPERQTVTGYFRSQEGEWDSNGQVLWIFKRFCELTGAAPKTLWREAVRTGASWIKNKRLSETLEKPHAGLFPAGFSAEHLGPNDFYYWDDFWGVEGLRAASFLMTGYGEKKQAEEFQKEAASFLLAIEKSLRHTAKRLGTTAMPSSPYRRLDTGSIGSLAAGYPLQLWPQDDARIMQTADYLLKNHFINGGFFHDMSHSGINPYLTLAVAQVLLRNGDSRAFEVMRSVQKSATKTGQWPEAIHPQTLGGCMGDGQHIWAAAEWVLMVRNCFVREEEGKLILASGVAPEWFEAGEIYFGKTPTPFGNLEIKIRKESAGVRIQWEGEWRKETPSLEIRLPGYGIYKPALSEKSALLSKGKPL